MSISSSSYKSPTTLDDDSSVSDLEDSLHKLKVNLRPSGPKQSYSYTHAVKPAKHGFTDTRISESPAAIVGAALPPSQELATARPSKIVLSIEDGETFDTIVPKLLLASTSMQATRDALSQRANQAGWATEKLAFPEEYHDLKSRWKKNQNLYKEQKKIWKRNAKAIGAGWPAWEATSEEAKIEKKTRMGYTDEWDVAEEAWRQKENEWLEWEKEHSDWTTDKNGWTTFTRSCCTSSQWMNLTAKWVKDEDSYTEFKKVFGVHKKNYKDYHSRDDAWDSYFKEVDVVEKSWDDWWALYRKELRQWKEWEKKRDADKKDWKAWFTKNEEFE